VKKIPMRMCVACRQMQPKNTLLRVVRTEDGSAVIDRTGKRNGRGAYLCAQKECFDRAMKARAIERALEVSLTDAIREGILREIDHAESAV